jgi:hypothetical protein
MSEPVQSEHVLVFADEHCGACQRDSDESCPILAGAFIAWPKEWLGSRCTAHWPIGEKEPVQLCPHTLELPLQALES